MSTRPLCSLVIMTAVLISNGANLSAERLNFTLESRYLRVLYFKPLDTNIKKKAQPNASALGCKFVSISRRSQFVSISGLLFIS